MLPSRGLRALGLGLLLVLGVVGLARAGGDLLRPDGHVIGGVDSGRMLAADLDGDFADELVHHGDKWWRVGTLDREEGLWQALHAGRLSADPDAPVILDATLGDVLGDERLELVFATTEGFFVLDGGTGERLTEWSHPTPRVTLGLAIADLVEGGRDEIAWLHDAGIEVLNATTGTAHWSLDLSALDLAVGNVDVDAALELVLAIGVGLPGLIIDAGTRSLERTLSLELGDEVLTSDLDGDGQDEVISLGATLAVTNAMTDERVFEHVGVFSRLALGNADLDPELEVLVFESETTLEVFDGDGSLLFDYVTILDDRDGEHVVTGDFDGDHDDELLYFGDFVFRTFEFHGFDLQERALMPERPMLSPTINSRYIRTTDWEGGKQFAADLITSGTLERRHVATYDFGSRRLHRAWTGYKTEWLSILHHHYDLTFVQLDDDPELEYLGRLILDFLEFTVSNVGPTAGGWSRQTLGHAALDLGDLDDDGAPELVVQHDGLLEAFETESGLPLWSRTGWTSVQRIGDLHPSAGREVAWLNGDQLGITSATGADLVVTDHEGRDIVIAELDGRPHRDRRERLASDRVRDPPDGLRRHAS